MPPRRPSTAQSKSKFKSRSNENQSDNAMSPYFALLASHKQKAQANRENCPHNTTGTIGLKRRRIISRNEPSKNVKQELESETIRDVIVIEDDIPMLSAKVKVENNLVKAESEPIKFKGKASQVPANAVKTQSITIEEFEKDEKDEDDEEDDEEDDSDIDWEDVPVAMAVSTPLNQSQSKPGNIMPPMVDTISKNESLVIKLGDATLEEGKISTRKRGNNAPGLTKYDRQQRLTIHKLHLLCLLSHVKIRNSWISNTDARLKLRGLLNENIRKLLHPENTVIVKGDSREFLSPILRTRKFLDGLKAAMDFWAKKFRINKRGIHLKNWSEFYKEPKFSDYDINITKDKFLTKITKSFNGSRDIAAQGFCALLRSVDVNARIVCSLQVVDYTSRDPWAERPVISQPQLHPKTFLDDEPKNENSGTSQLPFQRKPLGSSRRIRFKNGAPTRAMIPAPHHPQFLDSAFPVYWVEAYDYASQRWVSIDPCSKKIVEVVKFKSKLEPPLNDSKNTLSYVVAFDDQGFARDVTRRYTQFYNTKTRKKRVTNLVPQGKEWWEEKVMKACFEPKFQSDIDQIEIAELNNREINEKLPTNIQDFKNHPIFVLERHLKQTEILVEPRIPCGTLAVTGGRTVEKIFKRKDVRALKSTLSWYQLGRMIKPGQQALKMVKRKKFARKRSSLEDEFDDSGETEDNLETGLYSIEQTELYIPPAVINGVVPKNPFGNLDIYVPTMIPKGGIHLRSSKFPRVVRAAQELEIDYAPAVVGFDFGGGSAGDPRGTKIANPKIDGIVVPMEDAMSVIIICKELDKIALNEEKQMREAKALGKWRRYFSAIAIKWRLDRLHGKVDHEVDEKSISEDEVVEADGTEDKENRGVIVISSDNNIKLNLNENEPVSKIDDSWVKTHFFSQFNNIQNDIAAGTDLMTDKNDKQNDVEGQFNEDDDYDESDQGGGGFMTGEGSENEDGGFMVDENNARSGGFRNEDDSASGGFMAEDDNDESSGFMAVDDDESGGFMAEGDDESGRFMAEEDNRFIIEDDSKNGGLISRDNNEEDEISMTNIDFRNSHDVPENAQYDGEESIPRYCDVRSTTDENEPVCLFRDVKGRNRLENDDADIKDETIEVFDSNRLSKEFQEGPTGTYKVETENGPEPALGVKVQFPTMNEEDDTHLSGANFKTSDIGLENIRGELTVDEESEGDFFPDSMSESELLGSDYE